jgi:hypothetical protein
MQRAAQGKTRVYMVDSGQVVPSNDAGVDAEGSKLVQSSPITLNICFRLHHLPCATRQNLHVIL